MQQLGLALVEDDARWRRGGEYLRMAAHGLPALGPTLFLQIAQRSSAAARWKRLATTLNWLNTAGRSIGPKNLGDAERTAYFSTVKSLGEMAQAAGDIDGAIENYHLYAESERSGLETLRTLAELSERKGDPLSASALHRAGAAVQPQGRRPDKPQRPILLFGNAKRPARAARFDARRLRFRILP